MNRYYELSLLCTVLLLMPRCGPEVDNEPDLDPDATFTVFCEALFACPEAGAQDSYGSREECEDVHRTDYERRESVCQEIVLSLEDCLAGLSCHELVDDGCEDLRLRLGQEGCWPL